MNWVKPTDEMPDAQDIVLVHTIDEYDSNSSLPSLALWDGQHWTIQPFRSVHYVSCKEEAVVLWKYINY